MTVANVCSFSVQDVVLEYEALQSRTTTKLWNKIQTQTLTSENELLSTLILFN